MKTFIKSGIIGIITVLVIAGTGLAGRGNGVGDGNGPIHDIYDGVPFEVTGAVVSILPGQGMEITTADDTIAIYGIGPAWYWSSIGIERPAVGETITVSGYIVDYNGVERYIATTVDIGEDSVVLRDTETGRPLWRQYQTNGNRTNDANCFRNNP